MLTSPQAMAFFAVKHPIKHALFPHGFYDFSSAPETIFSPPPESLIAIALVHPRFFESFKAIRCLKKEQFYCYGKALDSLMVQKK